MNENFSTLLLIYLIIKFHNKNKFWPLILFYESASDFGDVKLSAIRVKNRGSFWTALSNNEKKIILSKGWPRRVQTRQAEKSI